MDLCRDCLAASKLAAIMHVLQALQEQARGAPFQQPGPLTTHFDRRYPRSDVSFQQRCISTSRSTAHFGPVEQPASFKAAEAQRHLSVCVLQNTYLVWVVFALGIASEEMDCVQFEEVQLLSNFSAQFAASSEVV